MQVILLDDVPGLGLAGDLVKVKDGYARNYLIPQGLAEKVSSASLNRLEQIKRAGEARRIKRVEDAREKVALLNGKVVFVPMKSGADFKLFGAVTSMLISSRIKEELGIDFDRRFIVLDEPLKYLGEFEVPLRVSEDVTGTIRVNVVDEGIYYAEGADAALAHIRGEEKLAKLPEQVESSEKELESKEGEQSS